jgi:hypothetical protein
VRRDELLNCCDELADVLVPVVRIRLACLHDHRSDVIRDTAEVLALRPLLVQETLALVTRIEIRDHVREDDAQRIQITADVDARSVIRLFRWGVPESSGTDAGTGSEVHGFRSGLRHAVLGVRDAEVRHLGFALLGKKNVRGFQISVDHRRSPLLEHPLVRHLDAVQDHEEEGERGVRARLLVEQLVLEIAAGNELERHVEHVRIDRAHGDDAHHAVAVRVVAVCERRHDLRFVDEATLQLLAGDVALEDLEDLEDHLA